MKGRWSGLLAMALFLVFCASAVAQQPATATAPSGESAGPKPRLVIENPIYEAGEIEPGTLVSHDFIIKNEGDAPLEITEVKPGCGCSTAMFDRVVAPGATGRISFSVRVYREWAGQALRKTAWVLTNDPLAPQARLVVDGRVKALPAAGADAPKAAGTEDEAPATPAAEFAPE